MDRGSIVALPGAIDSFALKIIGDQIIYIGRKTKPNLSANEKCIVLPYSEVSAKHAEIHCKSNQWTLVDTGSTNGTTINGVLISPGKEYGLKDQDIIGIANYILVVSIPNDINSQSNIDPELEQTRFQVRLINATILVADLKNFTGLMEKFNHDPSIVMQAAGNVFSQLNKEIERNQGQLEKIAGDAIMAYWSNKGGSIESGSSCYKACLSALRLKEVSNKIAKDKAIWPFDNHPLAFDIALATGTVAKGALGKSQGNPALLGDTANLAFRLEKLIVNDDLGKIIVDQSSYDLVKENFEFKFLGEFEIKGRVSNVNVYQLLEEKS
jgi:class 3 adenylate cyclase